MNKRLSLFVATLMLTSAYPVLAGDSKESNDDMKGQMKHGMGMMFQSEKQHKGSSKAKMQGGAAPANARDPHAFSDGVGFGDLQKPRLADEYNFGSVLLDRFEAINTADGDKSAIYDLQFWYGRDYDRLVIKAEGDYNNQSLEETSTEFLWSHALATFWNTQLGLRYDTAEDANQTWLGFGVQGLAPYWFEVDFTAYVGEQGRTAINVEADYEILITQKLILQPRLEIDINGKDDKAAGIGTGLSNATAGLRLRYEIRREFAPYVGVEWVGKYGTTADYARDNNVNTSQSQVVAGIRFWF